MMASVLFESIRYYRKRSGRFYSDTPSCSLHRAIYEARHGPIPKGHVVHHIDHDPSNNRIENLEAMSNADHTRHHNPKKVQPPCKESDCERPQRSNGLCPSHNTRRWRGSKARVVYAHCTSSGCTSATVAKGLCRRHYGRAWMRRRRMS